MARILKKIVDNLFTKHLFLTNTLSCGGLLGLGDAVQQMLEQRPHISKLSDLFTSKPYDWKRTGRMTLIGIILGPGFHYWYKFLDTKFPGRTLKLLAQKILLDELVASPVLYVVFFNGMGLLEGETLVDASKEFRNKFWEVYKMDWTVWPAAQAFNFYVLPPKYRVIYVNVFTLGWDIFLSYVKHRDKKDKLEDSGNVSTEVIPSHSSGKIASPESSLS